MSHVKTIHEKCKDFKCEQCGKGYSSQYYLNCHIKATHGEKNHSCDSCGKAFAYRNLLQNHVDSVHLKLTKFKCEYDQCSYVCATKVMLTNHKREVHRRSEYKCSHCAKFFRSKKALFEHEDICNRPHGAIIL